MGGQKIGRQNVIINSFVKENRMNWANSPITHAKHPTKAQHSLSTNQKEMLSSSCCCVGAASLPQLSCMEHRVGVLCSFVCHLHLLVTDHSWQDHCGKFSLLSSGWVNKTAAFPFLHLSAFSCRSRLCFTYSFRYSFAWRLQRLHVASS